MSLQRLSLVLLLAAALVARADIATHDHELSDEQHYQDGEHNPVYDHEAFLGRDEAAEFDELHPEESKERLRKLVTKIDLNGDGFVDGEEMKAWIAKQLRKYIYHDVETQFEANDVDKNGKVTWDEFVNTTYGYIDDEEFEKDPQFELMVKRDKRRFERADGDDDKALDKDEYVRFMHPEESPDMADIVIDETLEDMDKDKDGSLSVEEYLGDPGVDPDTGNPPDWVSVENTTFYEVRDTNHNGKMDRDEIREWIMPTTHSHVNDEASHLVQQADVDKDGKLSVDEIVNNYDLFVGSQMTDYGSLLKKAEEEAHTEL
ncbi:calumenin-like [Oscarella lobularis]|uniref:calumenin-like n=1 Tax=Oscarella lobularis TaxID=121494 RepID=UPI00331423EC